MLGPNTTGNGPRRLSHFTAREFLKYGRISEEAFESYFKFGFVRDPWDRVVSTYKYFRIGGEFKRFVCDVLPNSLMKSDYYGYFVRPQYEYLYDDKGECMVDYVGRFERLAEDFQIVRAKVGLGAELPHKNQHASPDIPLMSRIRQAALGLRALNLAHVAGAFSEKEVKPSARDYFDKESAAAIGEMYAADVKAFGYAFDRKPRA